MASTGAPAWIIRMIFRGRSRFCTSSSRLYAACRQGSLPKFFINSSVLAAVLLKTRTGMFLLARLRARLAPITAKPIKPIFAFCIRLLLYMNKWRKAPGLPRKGLPHRSVSRRTAIRIVRESAMRFGGGRGKPGALLFFKKAHATRMRLWDFNIFMCCAASRTATRFYYFLTALFHASSRRARLSPDHWKSYFNSLASLKARASFGGLASGLVRNW